MGGGEVWVLQGHGFSLLPEDVWFVIPIEAACRSTSVMLCPKKWRKNNGKFVEYRERWELMG
jgi:hypothetical protein